MKKSISILCLLMISSVSFAQIMPLTAEPDGGNKKASVSEQIGVVKIAINYSRPGVKGREGKIWNTPVAHYGFVDLGHGTSTAAPWRAGANENTTISFSHPVRVEGKDLPAGVYGFFIALGETESTLIFSKISTFVEPVQFAVWVIYPKGKIQQQDVQFGFRRAVISTLKRPVRRLLSILLVTSSLQAHRKFPRIVFLNSIIACRRSWGNGAMYSAGVVALDCILT